MSSWAWQPLVPASAALLQPPAGGATYAGYYSAAGFWSVPLVFFYGAFNYLQS